MDYHRSKISFLLLKLNFTVVIAISELVVAMDGHTLGDVVKQ